MGDPLADGNLLALARGLLLDEDDTAASPLDAIDLADPQQRRFGDYELLERIGRGGMGVVFRARQLSLQREVALKVIAGRSDDTGAGLLAEARAAAQLHHPHIVPVFETGLIGDVHFFSMPLLRGATLAQALAGRALPERDAVSLLLTLADAVGYAHSLGLLHLDLKPANVLLDEAQRPLIGDFGLACAFGPQADDSGDSSGTPAYMAPEQRDRRLGRLGPRSDIYALGAMLQEFLSGQPPGAAIPPPRPGSDIDAICRRCLQPDPALRYADTAALIADLARCRDGNEVSVRPRRWPERCLRAVRGHPALSSAVAVALFALLTGLLAVSWQWRRAEAAQQVAERERAVGAARAERLRQLAGLMAASFPASDADPAQRRRSARDAVAWLAGTASADQRELLDAFGQALRQAGKGAVVDELLDEIVLQQGAGYRRDQLDALLRRGDRDSLIAVVLLTTARPAADDAARAADAAARLRDTYPDDVAARYALALACNVQAEPCAHTADYARLAALAPANAVHWLVAPRGSDESDSALAARLHRAAQASGYDDHLASQVALLRRTLRDGELPDALRQPLQGMFAAAEIGPSLRRRAIDAVPLPQLGSIVRLCRPDLPALARSAGLAADCSALARLALDAPGASVLSRMIASAMLRRLHPGSALAERALAYRRQYVWLDEQFSLRGIDAELLQGDLAAYGEWEAWLRAADRSGIARMPANDWQPRHPQTLLLSEQRSPSAAR